MFNDIASCFILMVWANMKLAHHSAFAKKKDLQRCKHRIAPQPITPRITQHRGVVMLHMTMQRMT